MQCVQLAIFKIKLIVSVHECYVCKVTLERYVENSDITAANCVGEIVFRTEPLLMYFIVFNNSTKQTNFATHRINVNLIIRPPR